MKLTNIKIVLFYISIGIFFYILNVYSPFINDDYIYAFIKGDKTPVLSLSDAIKSQIYDYFHANGRFIIHVIVQYFCGVLGSSFFIICNSIMFTLLCLNFTYLLKNEFKSFVNSNVTLLFVILIMLFGVCRIYLDNISCSVNYLWTSTSILLFFIFWEKELNGTEKRTFYYIALSFISIIIGSLQESFSFGVSGALLIYYILKRKKLKKGSIVLIISFIVGTLMNVLAPSNFIRLEDSGGIKNDINSLVSRFFSCFYNSEGLLILLIFLIVFYVKNKKECVHFISNNIIIILSIVFNILFIIFIAYNGTHQLTCIELFSIILIIKLIYICCINFIIKYNKCIFIFCLSILLILYIPIFYCRRDVCIGHKELIKNAYNSKDGCVVAKKYYNSCLIYNNWFYKNFTRREIYRNYCKSGLSAIITNGANWKFIKTIIPDEKKYIIESCKNKNIIGKYIYKNNNAPYYIIKIPINENMDKFNIKVAYTPALIDRIKNFSNHILMYNIINKQNIDNFDFEDARYYIIYDSVEQKIRDIKVTY